MNRDEFLSGLRAALNGLRPQEIDDIVADYTAYFAEAQTAGRNEQDVASALGDPRRLAKELRAEAGLKRWENSRTPRNFFGAVVALCGLAAVDLFILLPVIFVLGFAALVAGFALVIVAFVGVVLLGSLLYWGRLDSSSSPVSVGLAGIGMLAGSIGWGALLLLGMEGVLKLLSKYARLHYQLIEPADRADSTDHG